MAEQTHCTDCEVALTLDERRYYGDRCEECERSLDTFVRPRDQFMEDYKRDTVHGMALEIEQLRAAATDALAGWRYIREHHGDLYGVGWDRVEAGLTLALSRGERS